MQHGINERALINTVTQDSLRFNQQDTTLNYNVKSRHFDSIMKLASDYEIFVLGALRKIIKVRNISMYGILFMLSECSPNLATSPVDHYLCNDFSDIRSAALHFTKRIPTIEALAMKDINDYKNIIYRINQHQDGKVYISVDYQEYFQPFLGINAWTDKPFNEFVDRGLQYLEGEFTSWLNKLIQSSEVA